MNLIEVEKFLKEGNCPNFYLKQIKKSIFQNGVDSFDKMTFLPKKLRKELAEKFDILPFSAEVILKSKDKKTFKALLKLKDGKCIETVLMNPVFDVWSVCVSTQVGCAMKCAFCATGKLEFQRNLTAEEIWGQVLFWRKINFDNSKRLNHSKSHISNVVYMGMGEPFNNLENVFESIKVLINKETFGLGQRSISVSTSGILPGIEKFGQQFPQVNLAISLHAANDRLRSELMPVNKTYNLVKLADSLKKYFTKSNRQIFIEYILLEGKNDSLKHAGELADYLKTIGYRHLLHVNLIVFNQIDDIKNLDSRICGNDKIFKPSSREQAIKFKNFLIENRISATIRKSMGQDISAACGQLFAREKLSAS